MRKIMFILLALLSPFLQAQEYGTLRGTVTDQETGEPLISANLLLVGSKRGAATDVNGKFVFLNVPAGTHEISVSYIGYEQVTKKNVIIAADSTTEINVSLPSSKFHSPEVRSVAESTSIVQNRSVRDARKLSTGYGLGAPAKGLPHRDRRYAPPDWNTEEYSSIDENDFRPVALAPLSTFSVDVDAASYANVRRFLLNDRLPPKDAVRTEECINYFDYDYDAPKGDHPLAAYVEYAECPWNSKNRLVHIGIKGKELSEEERRPANLVFLLDVSGSMRPANKLPLLRRAFSLLVDNLHENDRVAIVVYSGSAGCVLPSTRASDKKRILAALDRLEAGGSTAGGAGLKLAYSIAEKNFIEEANNRVILATDGDFNIGVSSTGELVDFIKKYRNKGIFLTALGFGYGNYKDGRLQDIADKGNGNHYYIDNIMEARKVFVHDLMGTLFTIAKDVKLQVEFNPAAVASYRLIGYENRLLNDEDFEDDTKDAGEIGAGHTVTALYEIVPAGTTAESEERELRYQQRILRKDAKTSGEILTLRVRYKDVDEDESVEFTRVLRAEAESFEKAGEALRFSAAVAEYSMLLRKSEHRGSASFAHALEIARESTLSDEYGYREEFQNLLRRAEALASE